MNGKDLKVWRKDMGSWTQKTAAAMLGVGLRSLINYEKREEEQLPRLVQLSCCALKAGVESLDDVKNLQSINDIFFELQKMRRSQAEAKPVLRSIAPVATEVPLKRNSNSLDNSRELKHLQSNVRGLE